MSIRTRFESKNILYVPATDHGSERWFKCQHCVWNGPNYLKSKPILRSVTKYAQLETFFRETLQIPNPTSEDILTCLMNLKDSDTSPDREELRLMYNDLYHEFRHDSQWGYLR